MSRQESTNIKNLEIIGRFTEACGTSQPAELSKLLNTSYQAAANYLNGRIPNTQILLMISEVTDYSVHWILTGEGEKFVKNKGVKNTQLLTDEMKAFVREICVEVIKEMPSVQENSPLTKTIILTPDNIRSEKVVRKITKSSDPSI